jgi:hypothetical protein
MICDDNSSNFSTNPAFVTAYKNYVTNITNIINTATAESQAISGITIDKSVARKKLCQTASEIAGVVFAFATSAKNNSLREVVNYSYSDLFKIKDDLLAPTVKNIYDAANNNLTGLESYGINAATLDSFKATMDDYSGAVPKPRSALSMKSTYSKNLRLLIKQTDEILKSELDKMVISFKANAPDFVSTYKNGRIIIDAAKSTTQIKGSVISSDNNSPLKNATVEIIGSSSLKTQTSIEGNFTFKPVTPGSYKINVTAEGSTDTTTSSIEVKLGKTAKVEILAKAS